MSDYIDYIIKTKRIDDYYHVRKLPFVWEIDDIENVLEPLLNKVIESDRYFGISKHYVNAFFDGLDAKFFDRAHDFLMDYLRANAFNERRVNAVVDIVRNSLKSMYEEVILAFVSLNQDVEFFRQIWWRGNGGSYSGDVIIGDIEAAEWRNIYSIVDKSDVGIKLLPIKQYINASIDWSLKSGDNERRRRFLFRNEY